MSAVAIRSLIMVGAVCCAGSSMAQFTPDEFNGASLGPQWTYIDGTPVGSTVSFTGTQLSIDAEEGGDHWFDVNTEAAIQQNAPAGTNWEVVTKIDNYDPVATGYQRRFLKSGIQLYQDNDHWITICLLNNFEGTSFTVQAYWQTDATPPSDDRTQGVNDNFTVLPLTPGGTFYFKIVKTAKGYLAQYSTDGTTFRNMLAPIRNPGTADGYFVNEKIRLFQTGGPGGTGVVKPVDFDYIRTNAVAAPPSGYADDEFDGATLGSQWLYLEGFGPGSYTVNGGSLNLTAGDGNDLWVGVDRASRVYQDAPTSSSYLLTVKASPNDLRTYEQWNSYGMMLWQDQSNWVMITKHRGSTTPPTNWIEAAFKRGGLFDTATANFGSDSCPEYLRIAQDGSTYALYYSFNNTDWTKLTNGELTYPAPLKNAQVHLVNKRVFITGDALYGTPLVASFDWIRATPPPTSSRDWQLFD